MVSRKTSFLSNRFSKVKLSFTHISHFLINKSLKSKVMTFIHDYMLFKWLFYYQDCLECKKRDRKSKVFPKWNLTTLGYKETGLITNSKNINIAELK